MPVVDEHLRTKIFVGQACSDIVDESSLSRSNLDEKLKLDEQDSLILGSNLTSPKTKIEIPTKPYVDSLSVNHRNTRDLSTVFNDQDNDLDNNELTNLDSMTTSTNPTIDLQLSNERHIDD